MAMCLQVVQDGVDAQLLVTAGAIANATAACHVPEMLDSVNATVADREAACSSLSSLSEGLLQHVFGWQQGRPLYLKAKETLQQQWQCSTLNTADCMQSGGCSVGMLPPGAGGAPLGGVNASGNAARLVCDVANDYLGLDYAWSQTLRLMASDEQCAALVTLPACERITDKHTCARFLECDWQSERDRASVSLPSQAPAAELVGSQPSNIASPASMSCGINWAHAVSLVSARGMGKCVVGTTLQPADWTTSIIPRMCYYCDEASAPISFHKCSMNHHVNRAFKVSFWVRTLEMGMHSVRLPECVEDVGLDGLGVLSPWYSPVVVDSIALTLRTS